MACCALQVRKIKRRACEYDYVEVMACPSACLNGGGQLPPAAGRSAQQLLEQLEQLYQDPQVWNLAKPSSQVQALHVSHRRPCFITDQTCSHCR